MKNMLKFHHEYYEGPSENRDDIAVIIYDASSLTEPIREIGRMRIKRADWVMVKTELQKIGETSPAWN